MSNSDSEDERIGGYQPVSAVKFSKTPLYPPPEATGSWPQDGVSLYNNELFHDSNENPANAAPNPNNAYRVNPKSTLAAKREERLKASIAEPNNFQKGGLAAKASDKSLISTSVYGNNYNGTPPHNSSYISSEPEPYTTAKAALQGLQLVYDPNEGKEDVVTVPSLFHRPASAASVPRGINIDASNISNFLHLPGSKTGPTLCYIVRDRESTKIYPKYMLFLEDGRRFLLSARKRKKKRTSNYVVSLDMSNLDRDGETFFGKVRANFVGTDFTLFDNGEKLREKGSTGARQELGCITYQYNVLGTRGPRKMLAAIPAVDASGHRISPPPNENSSILDRIKQGRGLQDIVMLRNKPPRWNDELGAYCLNFNGRVTEASVKNFQLVSNDNLNYIILQFGKIGENTFTMDFQWPMSAFQAFSICISSFDNKLACE